ncbi:cytochrome c-type biogenesis protein CcmH [Candidatus Pelagibacter sp.]|jgi:cytochrome c-type biogenesis protein CcmH|nr:cytochrome c-type biogenesis protein CcmH [Candidatus Pelagibacter sp.]
MKLFKFSLIIIFIFSFTNLSSQEKDIELRTKISKNIRCLVCQGQSIYDSNSDFANSMRIIIDKKLNEGLNENEIYDYLKIQYGEWITYDPAFNKKTFILWILPILLFLIGGIIILRKIIVIK